MNYKAKFKDVDDTQSKGLDIEYRDWNHFIQMDKTDWLALVAWLQECGIELEEKIIKRKRGE